MTDPIKTAFVICVRSHPTEAGERMIDIVCPHCQGVHSHRVDGERFKPAGCDPERAYRVSGWPKVVAK